MDEKFFLHRIQKENGTFTKGIEVHDTKDAAILSFWGRMKMGFNNPNYPNMTLVSCQITDINGNILADYDMTWKKEDEGPAYFMHYIRLDGDAFTKGIDTCATFDAARALYAAAMEYGYNNPSFPNVKMVFCEITDIGGIVMEPFKEEWKIAEPEPEPEPEV